MILETHIPQYERLRKLGAFRSPMLMLGNQEMRLGADGETIAENFFDVNEYLTFDPDGGDIREDLSAEFSGPWPQFATVFNLGTIEHIWDAHSAWCNALRLVAVGGVFITVSPVGGYENHGIHITNAKFIRLFIEQNGFAIIDRWLTKSSGEEIQFVDRGGGDQLLWLAAEKISEQRHVYVPQQIFRNGQPTE